MNVCVLEKGSEIGSHILSGNCFDSRALDELIPNWKDKEAPVTQKVKSDEFYFYFKNWELRMPTVFLPKQYKNEGNYIISLGQLCKWLAAEAEELGVDVLVGFAGSELLYSEDQNHVRGIATNDFGISKKGEEKDNFQRGMEITAPFTVLSEGARGSLSEEAIRKFDLRRDSAVPSYGLGFKEVWEFEKEVMDQFGGGRLIHTMGYPVDSKTYGGGFLYTMEDGTAQVGYIMGLDYKNPHLNLYNEFQLWKSHPHIRRLLERGRCIKYGARVISQGGYDAVPELTFPGGALIGCSAGFVDILKIKGTHNAMKTGMLLAEEIVKEVSSKGGIDNVIEGCKLEGYQTEYENSYVARELKKGRYVKQHFKKGVFSGVTSAFLSMWGWTLGLVKPKISVDDSQTMDSIDK